MRGRNLFYGWWIAIGLALAEPVSWGVLYYAFSVFIEPMQTELGWSRNQLTAAFSLGLLMAGVAAAPIGRWLDRHGPREVMTAGSVLAVLLLLGWSRVDSYPVFVLIWAGIGLAMAATFYEPAFAAIATWFHRYRSRALTLVTFGGGFASVVFIPLAAWLIDRWGWRDALVALAGILGVITFPLHAVVLRRRPTDRHTCPDGDCNRPSAAVGRSSAQVTAGAAWRSASFRWLALAFSVAMFVNVGTTVLLIPILGDRGHSAEFAAAAAASIGLLALPGRLIFTPLGDFLPRAAIPAAIFLTQSVALLTLAVGESRLAVWAFVALFGIGFGAITPARASLVADLYGVASFGGISGILALIVTFPRAGAPIGASAVGSLFGGDRPLLLFLAGLSASAAIAVVRATWRVDPSATGGANAA